MNFKMSYLFGFVLFLVLCNTGFCKSRQRRDNDHEDKVVVTVVLQPPFVIETEKEGVYDGYCIDLLKEVAKKADFEYEIMKVPSSMYGTQDESNKWTGAIGELVGENADMAVAPLTVTEQRERHVDFTDEYMAVKLTALIHTNITDIHNVTELADQDKVAYGSLDGGSTKKSFRETTTEPFRSMWTKMNNANPSVFVANVEFGLDKVREGNYALIVEQPMGEYTVGLEPCDLKTIEPFDMDEPRSYAFAFTQGHELVDDVNDALQELKDDGKLDKLYKKWWKSEKCENASSASGLQFSLGVFILAIFAKLL